jgi:hypothetical protein
MVYTPQSQIYTIFSPSNPLYTLAQKYPTNMCWLTTLLYALQLMGFENNRKLHYKLSYFLSSSLGLLFISKENGAMYFPKKYELNDAYIKTNLNQIIKRVGLKVVVERVLSDITFKEVELIEKYLSENKKLVTIIKNAHLANNGAPVIGEAANHAILITEFKNHQNGRVTVTFIDPADGHTHTIEIGINVFMQWIQYIWVLEKKEGILSKLFRKKMNN